MRRLPVSLVLALMVATVAATPAGALGAFDPPVEVVDPGCAFSDVAGDVVYGGDALAHGFVTFGGGSCGSAQTVWYFQGEAAGGAWTRAATPYRGRALATAWDTTGVYLLYQAADGLRLAKRTSGGVFTAGRRLSVREVTGGDLVARDGRWWAVWAEVVDPGPAQSDLFQAGTFTAPQRTRERITVYPLDDRTPALALSPAADTMLLVWARGAQVRSAVGGFDGRWASRAFVEAAAGQTCSRAGRACPGEAGAAGEALPDVAVTATRTSVAWQARAGRVAEAHSQSRRFGRQRFGTPGSGPRVLFADGEIVVGWTSGGQPSRAFLVGRGNRGWQGRFASPTRVARPQRLIGLVAEGGSVTAVVASMGYRLYAATER